MPVDSIASSAPVKVRGSEGNDVTFEIGQHSYKYWQTAR